MENIIEVQNLSKHFKVKTSTGRIFKDMFKPEKKEVIAVNDISFSITKGESVAFIGPNGAGKTTTTKMLAGLLYPTSGTASVLGYTPFDRDQTFLTQIGLVMGGKSGLNWDLTPNQSFELLQKIYKIAPKDFGKRTNQLLELLDVKDVLDIQVRKLSLGQRMKMELIASIIHDPKVLFLDEPTIGLDVISKQKVRQFLRQIQKEFGTTLLMTSHDMEDVERVCDRVIIINKGKLVVDEPLVELVEKYQKYRFVRFITPTPLEELELSSNGELISQSDGEFTFKITKAQLPMLIGDVTTKDKRLDDIDIISTPLEEIISDIFES